MLDFYKFMMRHGEHGVQAIVEQIERNEGVPAGSDKTLEDRWNALMQKSAPLTSQVAA